ncbi:hypothetical protein GGS20DRAFT_564927 [Poronia punctata]|nr:hypothetical protein GGS20DRAFT_564927 [Poronia punctata]
MFFVVVIPWFLPEVRADGAFHDHMSEQLVMFGTVIARTLGIPIAGRTMLSLYLPYSQSLRRIWTPTYESPCGAARL